MTVSVATPYLAEWHESVDRRLAGGFVPPKMSEPPTGAKLRNPGKKYRFCRFFRCVTDPYDEE
jgi:hypothetical protein